MTASTPRESRPRELYMDNIRLAMIMLVVFLHSAVTYSGFGMWYYKEPAASALDGGSLLFFAVFQSCTQGYFMGLLFLVAGYFVPSSFDKKGASVFIRDRLFRLGLPSLLFMLVINPFIALLRSFFIPGVQGSPGPDLAGAWAAYITSGTFLGGSGPLWFAVALLVFSLVFAAARQLFPRREGNLVLPSTLSPAMTMIGLGLLITAAAFVLRLFFRLGTDVLNMQLGYFAQYIILFIFGIAASRTRVLDRISPKAGRRILVLTITAGIVVWMAVMVTGGALRGKYDELYAGGFHWQTAAYAAWESFFAVGMCFGLLAFFRDSLNGQGRIAGFLSANAFCVYVFHAPVLVAVSLAMRPLQAPVFAKFLAAGVIALLSSFALSGLVLRRIPGLKRIL